MFRIAAALSLAITLLAPVALADSSHSKIRKSKDKVRDEYIVVFNDDVPAAEVRELAQKFANNNVMVRKVWKHVVKGFFAEMKEQYAEAIANHKDVKYVEENANWYNSASHPTNIDPRTSGCDPETTCPSVVDDRLWHLDFLDHANSAAPDNSFRHCTDGTGVTVYVLDTGVIRTHQEFNNEARLKTGYNASGDMMGTGGDDPCFGFPKPVGFYHTIEGNRYGKELGAMGHGTGVASALGGKRLGVAKNVSIVPIKTARCDNYSARVRRAGYTYRLNETMLQVQDPTTDTSPAKALYRAVCFVDANNICTSTTTGTTANPGDAPNLWPATPGATMIDGQVKWEVLPTAVLNDENAQTTQMMIDGLEWILEDPGPDNPDPNPGPKSFAIVTLSTYRVAIEPDVAGQTDTLESAIRSLLAVNITVIASANNQNGDACHTSPARMSANNPYPPAPASANNVITVGGSMLINRPWCTDISDVPGASHAAGGRLTMAPYGVEPVFDSTKPVQFARWVCGKGDSSLCFNDDFKKTADVPVSQASADAYKVYLGGSNSGPCITLFAPAKNIFVANTKNANDYRDGRIFNGGGSGTSWSAPMVAGFAARILQNNATMTPTQVREQLLSNSSASLVDVADVTSLNSYTPAGIAIPGTPNKLLHFADVNITQDLVSKPASESGSTRLEAAAGGTTTPTYQWYKVNDSFAYANFKDGAFAISGVSCVVPGNASAVAGATLSYYNVPASTQAQPYFMRATNDCGTADTKIAVVVPRPGPPPNFAATVNGNSVNVSWGMASGAEKYEVQRVLGGIWQRVGSLHEPTTLNSSHTLTDEERNTAGGIAVYRVRAVAGLQYIPDLPGNHLAASASVSDLVNFNSFADPMLPTPPSYLAVKAVHFTELRGFLKSLCVAVGTSSPYSDAEILPSALQGQVISANHPTDGVVTLMNRINVVRGMAGLPAATFGEPVTGVIKFSHLRDLRNALK